MGKNKITLTISHTINVGNYESIKPEVTNEFEYDNQITDTQVKSFLQVLEELWKRNLEQHIKRIYKILKAKGKNTGELKIIAEVYGVSIDIKENIIQNANSTPLY